MLDEGLLDRLYKLEKKSIPQKYFLGITGKNKQMTWGITGTAATTNTTTNTARKCDRCFPLACLFSCWMRGSLIDSTNSRKRAFLKNIFWESLEKTNK
jgi:hypothetical protein